MEKAIHRTLIPGIRVPIIPVSVLAWNGMRINEGHSSSIKRCNDRTMLIRPVSIPIVNDNVTKLQFLRPIYEFCPKTSIAVSQISFQSIGYGPTVTPSFTPTNVSFVPPARFSFSSIIYWGSACKEALRDIIRAIHLKCGEFRVKAVPPSICIQNSIFPAIYDTS
ncbi:hypothetical protein D3C73_1073050 [compost metagenome]